MTNRTIAARDKHIRALPACPNNSKASQVEYSFLGFPGLKILVSKARECVFYQRYTFNCKKEIIRLGRFPEFSLEEAIAESQKIRALIDRKIDPKNELRAAAQARLTFADFAMSEYKQHAEIHKRSVAADLSKLKHHVLPRFGHVPLRDIKTRDIQNYHSELAVTLSESTANRHLMLLSKIFSLAVQWEHLATNPCKGIKQFKEHIKQLPQLKAEDIAPLFRAMADEPNKVAVACIKMMLLTGARRSEVQEMEWKNIDFQSSTWMIEKTKSGKPHRVHLNDAALQVLREITRAGNRFVFPGRDPVKPINNPRKAFSRCLRKAGLEHMRLHSLRHAFCSFAVAAGASLYQVQKLVGHANASTTTRYAHLDNHALKAASQLVSAVVNNAQKSHGSGR